MAGAEEFAAHVVIGELLVYAVERELRAGVGAQEVGVPVVDDEFVGSGFCGEDGGDLVALQSGVGVGH